MRVVRRLLTAALLAAIPGAAMAQPVVWDNGAPIALPGGWGLGSRLIADDFTLAAPTAIGGVRLWAYTGTGFPLGYTGSMYWELRDVAAGLPGAVLASGDAATPAVYDFDLGANSYYRIEFSIPTQLLGPGQYFLALHDGASGVYQSGPFYAESAIGGNGWDLRRNHALGSEFAFQLLGATTAPEPATVVLVGGGLALVGLGARRRRQA